MTISTDLLNCSVMSFKPTLILSTGRCWKASLHRGHSDLTLESQKRLMQSRQKLCPHGMDTGFLKTSRQMLHQNCSSDNTEAMFLAKNANMLWISCAYYHVKMPLLTPLLLVRLNMKMYFNYVFCSLFCRVTFNL